MRKQLTKRYKTKKNKRKAKKRTSRRIKRVKIVIKNLGKTKKNKSNKRKQYGTCGGKKMKGGGPVFQPIIDSGRAVEGGFKGFYDTFMGNDTLSNEVINTHPLGAHSNYGFE